MSIVWFITEVGWSEYWGGDRGWQEDQLQDQGSYAGKTHPQETGIIFI